MTDYPIAITQAELTEMSDHTEALGRQVDALEPLAEAAVAYRQVLYAIEARGQLDGIARADLERVEDRYADALDTYVTATADDD